MIDSVRELVESPELWAGLATGLVSASLLALRKLGRPELAVAFAVCVAGAACGVASVPIAALLVVTALAWRSTRGSVLSVLASVGATFAAYVCVPDTERALVVLGSVLAVGLGAAVWRWRWDGAGAVTSVALAWVAITDGEPRVSAVVGTLGVVVVHQLLQLRLPRQRRPTPLLIVGLVAMAISARIAGLGPGLARPLFVVVLCLVGVAMVDLFASSPGSDPEIGEERRPPSGDGGE